jgi:hypothetical protein
MRASTPQHGKNCYFHLLYGRSHDDKCFWKPLILPHATKVPKMLTKPAIAKMYKIVGEGNCLFRALSNVITRKL